MKLIQFPVNNWSHLYSLERAIINAEQASGNQLSIHGRALNNDYLERKDTEIKIDFYQINATPSYSLSNDQIMILGQITRQQDGLNCELQLDSRVFNELKKNLLEYADIDGIHIMVTLGILDDAEHWATGTSKPLVKLDYAMRGDS